MKIGLNVGGVNFTFENANENNISYDHTSCNECLLNHKHCERMCHRIKEEFDRR